MCSIDDVAYWGPFIRDASRCGHLSFTLLFEEALMSMPLSTCTLLLALYRITVLSKESIKAKRSKLCIVKLVSRSRHQFVPMSF